MAQWQARLSYYVDKAQYEHVQQDCDRTKCIKYKRPNVWPNQMHDVVDIS